MPRNLALVADPNSGSIASLLPVLSKLGLKAIPARDGVEALRLVDRERPLMIIAELALEVVSGKDLCARLRQEENTRAIPFVLMGPGDERQGRLDALKCGADEFLSKPIDPEDARLRLEMLLRRFQPLLGTNGDGRIDRAAAATDADPARSFYHRLVESVNLMMSRARKGETLELDSLASAAESLAERFSDLVEYALAKRAEADFGAHQVNVAVIGLLMGAELDFPASELSRLALLGMVHDLGLARIPEAILRAPRRLSSAERRLVEEHPRHALELLRAAGRGDIGELAYQHHERYNGRGYPHGLRGNEIHPLALVTGVADVYESCTQPRSYDKTFIPYEALQQLIEMRDEGFPGRYIKSIMNVLTVYPVGSYVQLNTGEVGRVRATNQKNLMRPVVELFWGPRAQRLSPTKTVDLSNSPFLCVAAPLYEDQLPSRPT